MKMDLHLHTDMSDGSDSPLELLEKIEAAVFDVFSVTDHDDLRANAVILSAMRQHSYTAKFITGCEMASVFESRNLHLLCYNFDPQSESVKEMIAEGAALRRQRITILFDHLRYKHNIEIPQEYQADIVSRAVPGKVHIAEAIHKMGYQMTTGDIFRNYLDDMENREFKIDAKRVIDKVQRAGGVVSFAHPIEVQKEYNLDFAQIGQMTKRLKDNGLAAIEVYHSAQGKKEVSEYKNMATQTGLLISGGSDYHGKNKKVGLGRLTAHGYVPKDKEITILSLFLGDVNPARSGI
jgi:predicted metal-dependent phosphoesterase TrpH